MTNNEPVFTYERTGFKFWVYPNRIDVTENKGFFQKPQTTSIAIKNISDVQKDGIAGHIKLKTNDGKEHRYLIGPKADDARAAIAALL